MKLGTKVYNDSFTKYDKLYRFLFQMIWRFIGVVLPGRVFNGVKRRVINLFGGDCQSGSIIYSSARIYDPRNISMGEGATVGPYSIIYNVDSITIGTGSVVSQYAHLNTASHDYRKDDFPLLKAPIEIGANCWISTEVYVNMGVSMCDEVVVGARSSVFKQIVEPGVYVGSPAKKIKS